MITSGSLTRIDLRPATRQSGALTTGLLMHLENFNSKYSLSPPSTRNFWVRIKIMFNTRVEVRVRIRVKDRDVIRVRKEGNVLFNDALNTLRLLWRRAFGKNYHSDSERGNPLLPHGLLFPISSKGSFYIHHPTDRITHTTTFVTPVVEHWLDWPNSCRHWTSNSRCTTHTEMLLLIIQLIFDVAVPKPSDMTNGLGLIQW